MNGWSLDGVALVAIALLVEAGLEARVTRRPLRAAALSIAIVAVAAALLTPLASQSAASARAMLALVAAPAAVYALPSVFGRTRARPLTAWGAAVVVAALVLAPAFGGDVSEDPMAARLAEVALMATSAIAWASVLASRRP